MSGREDHAEPSAVEHGALEAFERFTEFEADLRRLGADWEADREVAAIGDGPSRGWVVVAVDRLLNGRPSVRNVFGPFDERDDACRYAAAIEENGTRLFVVGVSDPGSFPGRLE